MTRSIIEKLPFFWRFLGPRFESWRWRRRELGCSSTLFLLFLLFRRGHGAVSSFPQERGYVSTPEPLRFSTVFIYPPLLVQGNSSVASGCFSSCIPSLHFLFFPSSTSPPHHDQALIPHISRPLTCAKNETDASQRGCPNTATSSVRMCARLARSEILCRNERLTLWTKMTPPG